MAKTKSKKLATINRAKTQQLDTLYLLKLILYVMLGAQWLRFQTMSGGVAGVPVPLGFIVGLLFAAHDHFRIDRKIEYAVLIMAMFLGYWTQAGVYITI